MDDTPPGLVEAASSIAHELRNPLSAVKITLQTLARAHAGTERDARRLTLALREVSTMERVLAELVDFTRPPVPAPVTCEAKTLVAQAEQLAAPTFEERSVRLEVELDHLSSRVLTDPDLAARALAELLRNAAQAVPEGATVRLSLGHGELFELLVDDEGDGLPPGDVERLFQPFSSERARGLGLGLPLARAAARSLGGDLTLERRTVGTRAVLALGPRVG